MSLSPSNDAILALSNISRVTVLSKTQSEIFYICQASANQQRIGNAQVKQNTQVQVNVSKPSSSAINGSRWSVDDHEQLKKLLLQYGYSRWKQIQRSSSNIGGKLDNKPLP